MHAAVKYLGALSLCATLAVTSAIAAASPAKAKSADKNSLRVPGGLAFCEFKGYESWQVAYVSQNPKAIAVNLGNPTMIQAYQAGMPANGKPVTDGAKMAKFHWIPKMNQYFP